MSVYVYWSVEAEGDLLVVGHLQKNIENDHVDELEATNQAFQAATYMYWKKQIGPMQLFRLLSAILNTIPQKLEQGVDALTTTVIVPIQRS